MPTKLEGELAEAQALIQHLLAIGERSKAALARKLHDEIAELMVAALMDLTAAIPHLPALEVEAQRRLARAKATLARRLARADGWWRNFDRVWSKRLGYLPLLSGGYRRRLAAGT